LRKYQTKLFTYLCCNPAYTYPKLAQRARHRAGPFSVV
jgi:hypothetical protein